MYKKMYGRAGYVAAPINYKINCKINYKLNYILYYKFTYILNVEFGPETLFFSDQNYFLQNFWKNIDLFKIILTYF